MLPTNGPWWRKDNLPKDVGYVVNEESRTGGTGAIGLIISDFIDNFQQKIIISGPFKTFSWLVMHVAAGYRWQHTPTTNFECALFALEISLCPIFQLHGMNPLCIGELRDLLRSKEHRRLALRAINDYKNEIFPKRPGEMEPTTMDPQLEQEMVKSLLDTEMIHVDGIRLMIQHISKLYGIRIGLGILIRRSTKAGGLNRYDLQFQDSDQEYDEIAWIVNDNADQEHGDKVNHWSGIAPGFDLRPLDKSGQLIRPVQPQRIRIPRISVQPPSEDETFLHVRGTKRRLSEEELGDERQAKSRRYFESSRLGPRQSIHFDNAANSIRQSSVVSMDGVEYSENHWTSMSERELQVLRQGHNLPPDAQIRCFDNTAHITTRVDGLSTNNPKKPLYNDVCDGTIPEEHPPMSEVDQWNFDMDTIRRKWEVERAEELSRRQIYNAPSFLDDLPWKEMELRNISIEEMIVYFPNHVVRWPFFALYLRMKNWDRLFFRVTRLINLARGSHYSDERNSKHVEVLPLMMKMERAIREVPSLENYRLENHNLYADNLSQPEHFDYILENLLVKPKGFPREPAMATLPKAAGYITGQNEFQQRDFSKGVLFMQPNRPPPRPQDPFARSSGPPLPSWGRPNAKPQNTSGGSGRAGSLEDDGYKGDNEDNDICLRGGRCPGKNKWCKKTHIGEKGAKSVLNPFGDSKMSDMGIAHSLESTRDPGIITCPEDPWCDDVDCNLHHPSKVKDFKPALDAFFDSPTDTDSLDNVGPGDVPYPKLPKDRPQKLCFSDPHCSRGNCKFAHPQRDAQVLESRKAKDAAPQMAPPPQARLSGKGKGIVQFPCGDAEKCQKPDCIFTHPTHEPNDNSNNFGNSNRNQHHIKQNNNPQVPHHSNNHSKNNGSNAQTRQQMNMTQNNNNSNHPQKTNTQSDQRKTLCRYDTNCKNADCPYGHRSPAAPPNGRWEANQWCKFGARCRNAQCVKNHCSAGGKKGGVRRSGNGGHGRGV